jgi:hypothetical protein
MFGHGIKKFFPVTMLIALLSRYHTDKYRFIIANFSIKPNSFVFWKKRPWNKWKNYRFLISFQFK